MAEGKPGKGRWSNYKVEGDKANNQNSSCPKCGSGFLMAAHKDRRTCGKCGYTEKI